ncbi:HAD hydrolase family protein [Mycoplasma sp. ATU-Cv-508]
MVWGKRRGKIKRLTEQLRMLVPSASVVNSTRGWTIEVTDQKATKGLANRYVWEKLLRIKKIEQTAHVGDSLNDSTVVGHVGHLIALKNADPALKKMASILGPDFRNGGVAKVLAGKNLKAVKLR